MVVAGHIGNTNIDRARKTEQNMAFKLPVAEVPHPANLTLVVAELGHGQIQLPITIKICRPHIRDPGNVFGNHMLGEMLVAVILENND